MRWFEHQITIKMIKRKNCRKTDENIKSSNWGLGPFFRFRYEKKNWLSKWPYYLWIKKIFYASQFFPISEYLALNDRWLSTFDIRYCDWISINFIQTRQAFLFTIPIKYSVRYAIFWCIIIIIVVVKSIFGSFVRN